MDGSANNPPAVKIDAINNHLIPNSIMATFIYFYVKTALSGKTAIEVSAYLRIVVKNIFANAAVFVNPTPTVLEFETALDQLDEYIGQAESGLKTAKTLRDKQLKSVIEMARLLASYVQEISQGDKDIIQLSGFGVRNNPTPAKALSAPAELKIIQSKTPDALDAKVKKEKGARSYIFEVADADPTLEANWELAKVSSTVKTTIPELESGKMYYFRAAAVNSKGQSMWSEVANARCA